jgi:hypothetical protein
LPENRGGKPLPRIRQMNADGIKMKMINAETRRRGGKQERAEKTKSEICRKGVRRSNHRKGAESNATG